MNQNPKNKITESLQEQLPLFSTPESHYIFKGPPTLSIKSAVKGQKNYCTLDHNCWSWMYGGNLTNLDWTNYNLNPNLKEILKAFIFHRLQTLSPANIATWRDISNDIVMHFENGSGLDGFFCIQSREDKKNSKFQFLFGSYNAEIQLFHFNNCTVLGDNNEMKNGYYEVPSSVFLAFVNTVYLLNSD